MIQAGIETRLTLRQSDILPQNMYIYIYIYILRRNYSFGLGFLFNGISTLFRLFNAKAILLEEQQWYYLT